MTAHTIRVDAEQYADHDDCLTAAQKEWLEENPEFEGWDLNPRWEDDQREAILLDIPGARP